ncbi:Pls/PosA family non-ribosomal peptide synthetase [Pedococcus sp.]|uniref:Pls/PosA family non-ribosomal peptide synthetase n=1 Tax=Pedococcus sp. TaxID=2860345 RepID=UPI002E10C9D7|nr:Pls/PosA family non-ribosomal peptide synthetase [Pedococcus sp.]
MSLHRGPLAPSPRTLVDILDETVAAVPDEPAIDNGATVLTYSEFHEASELLASELVLWGVGPGDRVGIRLKSGTTDLYVAIMGTLLAGAAYVPVDADDPEERARTVFTEAAVAAVVTDELVIEPGPGATHAVPGGELEPVAPTEPETTDDAWVIFTSGSTGLPKGVAVSHRSAAAFVDAEARLFLRDAPLTVGDRVMAGLSVAFDASCEEMWLAWRYGACLVPAPRSLVRSGMELGPWLVANRITVVSTVPTLAALWPAEALAAVRLLILGGEACPPEIGTRLATPTREVWNTYGPTEATVVACAARLTGEPPVRIGLPLDGWDLAVVDGSMQPVEPGETGELIIGGVGLARYLDPAKDAEKYAPMPTLGWERAYRSGDLVRNDPEGLVFVGRADDQVKVGGRRIELGEVDSALLSLPGVNGAATAVRHTGAGHAMLVGYLVIGEGFDLERSLATLRDRMPSALVPRLVEVDDLPTRTSGKIDRDALPWPVATLAGKRESDAAAPLEGTAAWLQELWLDVVGAVVSDPDEDFFDVGGGSLAAAHLVSRLRERFPEVTVADVYDHPRLGDLAATLDDLARPSSAQSRLVRPVPLGTQLGQVLFTIPVRTLTGLRWVVWVAAGDLVARSRPGLDWLPSVRWWVVLLGWLVLVSPAGRLVLSAAGARALLAGVTPGRYPRGGWVHLRLWAAERLTDELGAANLAGAPWMRLYARALGAHVGKHVDLHAVPPVTGMISFGDGCSVEPEVDLFGHWLDGDELHIGSVEIGPGARIGARSTLAPGSRVGADAEVAPGSAVFGAVPDDESWAGAPARRVGRARGPWDDVRPRNKPRWLAAYGLVAVVISALPGIALVVATLAVLAPLRSARDLRTLTTTALIWLPVATVVGFVTLAVLVAALVRLLGIGLGSGHHPIHGRQAWQAWSTIRVLDEARTWLFPLYSSTLTPLWLRLLGARIGKDVEASTVLLIPKLTTVGDGAFLADDTLLGGYELGGGWLRVEHVKVGKHAFVGNSGMTAPGRRVPKRGLVAVLSAAPRRKKARAGTSWLGSPPTELRRTAAGGDTSRTYDPAMRLRVARALVEVCRLLAVMVHVAICVGIIAVVEWCAMSLGWAAAALLTGLALLVAGAVAALASTAAKWVLVGRVAARDVPLWSSFVWRNELADTFVEVVAAPWFARGATGTVVLNWWLRTLGAQIGRGVWCETYWLPEADLIALHDGATVNRGCVVQTHLFHDRVLSMSPVVLRTGATLGSNGVVLPAAVIGKHATVGPVSLVMRGESVPDGTRWIGNPIGPWTAQEGEDAS